MPLNSDKTLAEIQSSIQFLQEAEFLHALSIEKNETAILSAEQLDRARLFIKILTNIQTRLQLFDHSAIRINQLQAIQDLIDFAKHAGLGDRRGYFRQPTGAGKSRLMGIITKLLNLKTLVLVPRTNLLEQNRDEFLAIGLLPSEIGIVGDGQEEIGRPITLCTYQSLPKLISQAENGYELVIADEAHRGLGDKTMSHLDNMGHNSDVSHEPSYGDVENYIPRKALLLGFTATPELKDKSVENFFGKEISRVSFAELVRSGILTKFKLIHTHGEILPDDITGSKITTEKEIEILERENIYQQLIDKYLATRPKINDQLKTAVFCATISECDKFLKLAEASGLRGEIVTSREDQDALKRAEEKLSDNQIDLILTVEKLAEGWNFPELNSVILARATLSPVRILQPVGRAARAFPKKSYAYIFETRWNNVTNRKKDSTPPGPGPEGGKPKPPSTPPTSNKGKTKPLSVAQAFHNAGEVDIPDICVGLDGSPVELTLDYPPMDEIYFKDSDIVRADLQGYANTNRITIQQLNTSSKLQSSKCICQNGESVFWNTYLKRANQALHVEDFPNTLTALKQIAGINSKNMDQAYFRDATKVRTDLEAYAQAIHTSTSTLKCSKAFRITKATCQNGDTISGTTYLKRASQALNITGEANTLTALKQIAGINSKNMDQAYFRDATKVRTDLEAYAQAIHTSISALKCSKAFLKCKVICQNSQSVLGITYLKRASQALNVEGKANTLTALKQIASINSQNMDQAYFRDATKVRTDLEAYAQTTHTSISALKCNDAFLHSKAICQNSESVLGNTYLNRASQALNIESRANTLIALKQIAGIEVKTYSTMDTSYFSDASKIRADLEAYAQATHTSISALKCSKAFLNSKTICQNNESVFGFTYLRRAGKALNIKNHPNILAHLKTLIQE